MFLVDDAVMSPFKGLMWLAREIDAAARRAREDEAAAITRRLSELYTELEAGRISEDDFDDEEERLLDRLDALQGELDEDEEDDDILDTDEDPEDTEDTEDSDTEEAPTAPLDRTTAA